MTEVNDKKKEITAKLENGKTVTFNCERFHQYDLGYATTAYKAQGKTVNQVVILAESYRENVMTQKSFYVSLSRAQFHAKIFTNNKEELSRALSKRPGHKTSSLEQAQMKNAIDKILEKNSHQVKEPLKSMSFSI